MHRRTMIRGLVLAPIAASFAAPLAGCGSTTPAAVTSAVQQAVSDVGIIASALAALLPTLGSFGVPAATVTQIQGYVATLQTDASALASAVASAASSATGTVSEIATVVGQIAAVALPTLVPGATGVVAAIQAATSLLPTILSAFGVTGAAPVAATYPPDVARLILKGAAT